MKKDRTIGGEAVNIVVLDTFVALMAGFIIIPACFHLEYSLMQVLRCF